MPYRLTIAIALLTLLVATGTARAMQFKQESVSGTEVFLVARGPIIKDDAARLEQAVAAVPSGTRILALAVDSPGGLVAEGERVANLIRARGLPIVVAADRQCVSACFLLFAASPRKFAEANALVGVHSASENGQENEMTMAVTVQMVRIATALGVPASIVGKMARTRPGSVEWLTQEDLASMGVKIYTGNIVEATRAAPNTPTEPPPGPTPGPNVPPPPGPVTTAPPTTRPGNEPTVPQLTGSPTATPRPPPGTQPQPIVTTTNRTGFAAGQSDRSGWDSWLAAQAPGFRDGAILAMLQSGLSGPAMCRGPNNTDRGLVTRGCEAALQRLESVEPRRKSDPDYAAGWNSRPLPSLPIGAIDQEYQGAYFCGRQIARLSVQVFPASGEAGRRALFEFGPQATSPDVPHGAFVVQGSYDPATGTMQMHPVKWLLQPPQYNWFGVVGKTADDAVTFRGQITDNLGCTTFTLKRKNDTR